MLVLTRRDKERVRIQAGEHEIWITVWLIGDKARLGFDAPREVTIDREEIHLRKMASAGNN